MYDYSPFERPNRLALDGEEFVSYPFRSRLLGLLSPVERAGMKSEPEEYLCDARQVLTVSETPQQPVVVSVPAGRLRQRSIMTNMIQPTRLLTALLLSLTMSCTPAGDSGTAAVPGKPIQSAQAGGLTVTIASQSGVLKSGRNEVILAFTDASGKPVDVSTPSLQLHMPAMGSMPAMTHTATVSRTGTGQYAAPVEISMAGQWEAVVTFAGPAGQARAAMPVSVSQ